MRIIFPILILLCSGCTSIEKIGIDEYKITVSGSPFDDVENLKSKVRKEAEKLCVSKRFEFIKNYFNDDFSFEQEKNHTSGAAVIKTKAVAKIKCLE